MAYKNTGDDTAVVRGLLPEDKAYIFATWSNSAWIEAKRPPRTPFFRTIDAIVKDVMENGRVFVACLQSDPEFILGYLALDPDGKVLKIHTRGKNDGMNDSGVEGLLSSHAQTAFNNQQEKET